MYEENLNDAALIPFVVDKLFNVNMNLLFSGINTI